MHPDKVKDFLEFITFDQNLIPDTRKGLLYVALKDHLFAEAISETIPLEIVYYTNEIYISIGRRKLDQFARQILSIISMKPLEEKHANASLIWASKQGYTRLIDLHLKAGVKLSQARYRGYLPLVESVRNLHIEFTERLLENGANPSEADSRGVTPLVAAARNGEVEITNLLLEYGAQTRPAETCLYSPLLEASKEGHTPVAQLLLHHGADPKEYDGYFCGREHNALIAAATNGHTGTVKALLPYFGYNDQISLEKAQDVAGIRNCHETARLIGGHIHQLRMNPPLKDKDRRHSVTVSMSL